MEKDFEQGPIIMGDDTIIDVVEDKLVIRQGNTSMEFNPEAAAILAGAILKRLENLDNRKVAMFFSVPVRDKAMADVMMRGLLSCGVLNGEYELFGAEVNPHMTRFDFTPVPGFIAQHIKQASIVQ